MIAVVTIGVTRILRSSVPKQILVDQIIVHDTGSSSEGGEEGSVMKGVREGNEIR